MAKNEAVRINPVTGEKWKPIPRSRAKTAWELLLDVKIAILEEPKRIYMGEWIIRGAKALDNCGSLPSTSPIRESPPACGTVGCFAGWVSLLKGHRKPSTSERFAKTLLGPALKYKTAQIRYPNSQTVNPAEVFDSGVCDPDFKDLVPGTHEYALAVCRRIDKFMRVNEQALRRRKLK